MAGIIKRKDWYYVRFVDPEGIRRTIALQTKSERRATNAKLKIEDLVSASKTGHAVEPETRAWLAKQKDSMQAKLAKFGVVQIEKDGPTETLLTLGKHIDDYLTRRTDVKGSTKTNWGHTRRNLIAFFGDDKPLAEINAGDAKDFERYLKTEARENAYAGTEKDEGLRPDTVRKRIGNAKQFFGDAVEHELIDRNPFVKLKSSVIGNRDRDFFRDAGNGAKSLRCLPRRSMAAVIRTFSIWWITLPERTSRVKARFCGLGRGAHPR